MKKRLRVLGIRMTNTHNAALKRMCDRENRTQSNMLRECIRREAQRQGLWQEGDNGAH